MNQPIDFVLLYVALAEALVIIVLMHGLKRATRSLPQDPDDFNPPNRSPARDPRTGRFLSTKDRTAG